jgi:hypothetical protein
VHDKFRGVVELEFATAMGQKTALALHGSQLGGRTIAVAREESESAAAALHTVFVSKLNTETTVDRLKGYFSSCGTIEAARVVLDKATGKSKVLLNTYVLA